MNIPTEHVTDRQVVAPPAVLPRFPAVGRLAEVLANEHALPEPAAGAIAVATTDAAAFRRSLQAPLPVYVPGGTLHIVPTRVWAPAVIPHVANTRISPWLNFPISGAQGRVPLARPEPHPQGASTLMLEVANAEEFVAMLAEVEHRVEMENRLDDDIAAEGIREAITLVAMTVRHSDGEPDVTVMTAVDGSSRVAAAHRNLSIAPDTAVYRYSKSSKLLRGRIGRTLAIAERDILGDDAEVTELNSLTMPAMVIVGYTPHDESPGNNIARAVEARVGNIHVNPPKPWTESARVDAQLNAVLDRLELETDWASEWIPYYAGTLSLEAAAECGLSPHADIRAADFLMEIHNSTWTRAIHDALRAVSTRQPTYRDRAAVAAEATLRSFRNLVRGPEADSARNLLRHLYVMEEFRSKEWSVNDKRSLDDLLDDALREVEHGATGPAGRELLAYATFWLARYALVRRTTRGGDTDRTDITMVLRRMVRTEWGVRVLHRMVKDGRRATVPRRVDAAGTLQKDARGEYLTVDERWIRRTWSDAADDFTTTNPEVQLVIRRDKFAQALRGAKAALDALAEPRSADGRPLVESEGLPPDWTVELLSVCADIQGRLAMYRAFADR